MIAENTTLVLSTDSDLLKFLKGVAPEVEVAPTPASGAGPLARAEGQ